MKKIALLFFLTVYSFITFASHITGGEMSYEYLGPGTKPNARIYRITLKLFRDQNTKGAPMPPSVFIGVFNNDNNQQVRPFDNALEPYFEVPKSKELPVTVDPFPPCVKNPTALEYAVGFFSQQVELTNNQKGYTVTYQTCCRVIPLNNVTTASGTGGPGSSYTCNIPPEIDNSPIFSSSVDMICQNRDFTLNFKATDIDGDSLLYSFAEAYDGGKAANANNINPAPPPYLPVEYSNGFSGDEPLGSGATIDPVTGIISGIAPVAGKYVVSVEVASYKNNRFIAVHRKDFIVNVGDCDVPGAELKPKPVTCDGFTVSFTNNNPSALNKKSFWDFGDPKSGALDTSVLPNPVHVFSDTGTFVYKLIVNKDQACSDSTTQTIKVYPGFFPGFTVTGQCKNTPIQFNDTSKSKYGTVSSWSWNFGDPQAAGDTAHVSAPSYTFSPSGNYDVKLIVGDNHGCIDTVVTTVVVKDKPDFKISHDTLICAADTLQLQASGAGTFLWTPRYNISDQNTPSPLVSPDVPTKYYADFSDAFGCTGSDSIFVDVRSFVTLSTGNDTSICRSDAILLKTESDALHYKWAPSGSLNNDSLKDPSATPLVTTTYTVSASIGKCTSTNEITVKVAPYPNANAGKDSSICLGSAIQLNASGGSLYKWSPAFFLSDSKVADPTANPLHDINYVVSVADTLGCPKVVNDSVFIRVLDIVADAGPRDTSVVLDQPLQLNASGGEFYIWTPAAGLSNPTINNPIANLTNSQQYVVLVSQSGCFDTDTINVTVYKVQAGIYVPNAFTPNNDGVNDLFRPVPIGMKRISYFRVYNRWGKLLFSSAGTGKGWDGKFEGKLQDPAVYVWMVEGVDYRDNTVAKRGSVVLIR